MFCRPSDSSTWEATKHASHDPLTLAMWICIHAALIDIAKSLSFRNKIAWVFESRLQAQVLTINCAALKQTSQNILRGYCHVLARPVGFHKTHRISRDLVPRDLVTFLMSSVCLHVHFTAPSCLLSFIAASELLWNFPNGRKYGVRE